MFHRKYDQSVPLEVDEIISYLVRRDNKKSLPKKEFNSEIKKRIIDLKIEANKLFVPQSVYKIFKTSDLPSRIYFEEAEKVVLAIVTIGTDLPDRVDYLMNQGEYVDGIVLDAMGSVGVETVADIVNLEINQKIDELSVGYSKRYSPGFCQWDVKDQEIFFNLLSAHLIGVSLTKSYLMSPIKSVSFAVNIGENIAESKWENRCKHCDDRSHCIYRLI